MKEIGGYFKLEFQGKEGYHKKALKLNSGRNCFKYILEIQRVTKVYIPNYIFDSIIEPVEEDLSENYNQLIGRIKYCASNYFENYQQAEQHLANAPLKLMSKLTTKILNSIDYKDVKRRKKRNYNFLHNELKQFNKLDINLTNIETPFSCPFISSNNKLTDRLIKNKIYIAKYWNEILDRETVNNYERYFVDHIIPLPIDQRYDL